MIMLQTINGMISLGDEDDLSWGGRADKKHFSQLSKEIGTIIMGSSTFDALGGKPLPKRGNIVMSRNVGKYNHLQADNLEFTNEEPKQLLDRLSTEGLEQVAVTGGGKINALFLKEDLIDTISLTIAPKLFTSDISLVDKSIAGKLDINLELEELIYLDEHTINLNYKVVK